MKLLKYYTDKDYNSELPAFNYFLSSLRNSIFTWDYYVDFNKSIRNADKIKEELIKMNSLIGLPPDEIEDAFIDLLKTDSKIRKIIPILIAIRTEKMNGIEIIDDLDTLESESKIHLFDPRVPITREVEEDLVNFFKFSGLKELLEKSRISNLYDYCIGIEVGMDTNARKNRTGTNMENLVESVLSNFCERKGYKCMVQATHSKIKSEWGIDIVVDKINRRFDFAIMDAARKLHLFEVNYYSGGGSKLKATAGEYKEVYNMLSSQDIQFIWVTDGMGWLTAKTALYETFLHNEFVINLEMISNGILEQIIS